MTNAVIVSTARTPLAKSWKGAFNMTHGATLGGHAVQHAVARAGIEAAEVEDVIMGCANPEGATGANIARQIALKAGMPISVSGLTVNRFCSSGLQTIALAAQRIIAGEGQVYVAGGVESISCVQQEMNLHMLKDPSLEKMKPEIYWNMLQTAEQVAKRYKIGRDRMDEYGAASQQKACAAAAAGKFDDEIAPITVTAGVYDKTMGLITKQVTVSRDEGLREGTTVEGISGVRPALPGGLISAGNASQFSDGGGAVVVMHEKLAEQKGLKPLGRFLGFAVAGCEPDEMGIGPVYAVPKALARLGLTVNDIDLTAVYDDSKSINEGALTIPGFSIDGWYGRIFNGCGFFALQRLQGTPNRLQLALHQLDIAQMGLAAVLQRRLKVQPDLRDGRLSDGLLRQLSQRGQHLVFFGLQGSRIAANRGF